MNARIKSRSYLGARFQFEVEVGDAIAKVESQHPVEDADTLLWVPSAGSMAFLDNKSAPSH
ncbi:hypothetical protein [Neorhizobium petrolearium]|uniref:hypothetical protein n=1 Tax=Neorhizobium petrolearium TaxID=515361 RepID=UPI003F153D25